MPRGWSVFWRPAKRRWVLSAAPNWRQEILTEAPREDGPEAQEAATRAALARMASRPAPAVVVPTGGMLTSDAVTRWLALAEGKARDGVIAPATVRDYRTDASAYILPRFGAVPLAALDLPTLRAWFRDIRGTRSASTIRGLRSSLSRLVSCAMAEGWIPERANALDNPELVGELPPLPEARVQVVPLGWVQALVSAVLSVSEAWRLRYALAVSSGARDGEIHGARVSSLDLADGLPSWRITETTALAGPDGFATRGRTKTRTSIRTMPLHPAVAEGLRAWLAIGWRALVGRAPRPDDIVFPGTEGQPVRPRSAEQLRRDLTLLGMPAAIDGRRVEFKALRATFATLLLDAGIDEHDRSRLMGHASRTVTERHYTRRTLGRLADAVRTIPLTWPTVTTTPAAQADLVTVGEEAAIPGRFERPTCGLGNRCSDGAACDLGAQGGAGAGDDDGSDNGEHDDGSDRLVAGHKRATFAAEVAWWASLDVLVLDAGEVSP